MPILTWEPTVDGFEADGFVIRRLAGDPPAWRLETSDAIVQHGAASPTSSVHPTLLAARQRAEHDERERIAVARVRGHVTLSITAGLLFIVLLTTIPRVEAYLASMFFLWLTLRSLVDAVEIHTEQAWGSIGFSPYDAPSSWTSRLVWRLANRLRRRQLAVRAEESPAIIVLPPE